MNNLVNHAPFLIIPLFVLGLTAILIPFFEYYTRKETKERKAAEEKKHAETLARLRRRNCLECQRQTDLWAKGGLYPEDHSAHAGAEGPSSYRGDA